MTNIFHFGAALLLAAHSWAQYPRQCSVIAEPLELYASQFDQLEARWYHTQEREELLTQAPFAELANEVATTYDRALKALLENEDRAHTALSAFEQTLMKLESELQTKTSQPNLQPYASDDPQHWDWLREDPKLLPKRIKPDVTYRVALRNGQQLKVRFNNRVIKEVFTQPGRNPFARQALEIITRGFREEEPSLWRRRKVHESFVELRASTSERLAGCFEDGVLVFKAFFKRPEKQAYHLFNQLASLCR